MATATISNTSAAQASPVIRRDSQRPAAARARSGNFGGPRLKLSVLGEIPGHHLYWENDDEGAIEQLLYEGFEFVAPDEVNLTSHIVQDADLAHRVSRYVGKKADGSPMRAYLLKCPEEIWAEREHTRYEAADNWDNAVRNGQVAPDSNRYRPKGTSNSVDTQFKKQY